jgi:uncharacterized protein (DUF58 family)
MPPPQGKLARPRPPIRQAGLQISLNGLIYACITLFMGLAAMQSQQNLLYGVFGLMIGVLLVSGTLSRRILQKLHVQRQLPDHGTVGKPLVITYRFENRKHFTPTLSVNASELDGAVGFSKQPQAFLLHTPGKSNHPVPAEVLPLRRGLHRFARLQVSTSFPFGFIRRAFIEKLPDKLLIYPPIATVDKELLSLCRAAEHSGASMRPRPGGQDEFYGVREYRPGENPRNIHWRRSARTMAQGTLVAREMTQVAPPRLFLLVDTWLIDRSPAEFARVEQAIAIAASVAAAALDSDLSVGLLAWTGEWKRVDPSRGKRHRTDLLSLLALLPMNVTQDTSRLLDQGIRRARDGTTAVLCTPRKIPAGPDRRYRGALVVVPAESQEVKQWFRWEPPVDFATCVPIEQVG